MKKGQKLNLKHVQYLLVHKPLVIVQLQHSEHNKKLISKALQQLWRDRQGPKIFETLQIFLRDRAPKYDLTPDQMGARSFLLRQLEQVRSQPQGKSPGFAGIFGFST
ncbi:MAG: hypothetical protein QNK37_27040 [Acidobacteriota bacterium]|nr:hypothetical protein [Acidobacteriota bacterium]